MFFKNKKGFTLIEIFVVISIISTLVLIVTPNFIEDKVVVEDARIQKEIKRIESLVKVELNKDDEFLSKALKDERLSMVQMEKENFVDIDLKPIEEVEGDYYFIERKFTDYESRDIFVYEQKTEKVYHRYSDELNKIEVSQEVENKGKTSKVTFSWSSDRPLTSAFVSANSARDIKEVVSVYSPEGEVDFLGFGEKGELNFMFKNSKPDNEGKKGEEMNVSFKTNHTEEVDRIHKNDDKVDLKALPKDKKYSGYIVKGELERKYVGSKAKYEEGYNFYDDFFLKEGYDASTRAMLKEAGYPEDVYYLYKNGEFTPGIPSAGGKATGSIFFYDGRKIHENSEDMKKDLSKFKPESENYSASLRAFDSWYDAKGYKSIRDFGDLFIGGAEYVELEKPFILMPWENKSLKLVEGQYYSPGIFKRYTKGKMLVFEGGNENAFWEYTGTAVKEKDFYNRTVVVEYIPK